MRKFLGAVSVALFFVAGSLLVGGALVGGASAQEPDVVKLAAGLASGSADEQVAAADALADLGPAAAAALPQLVTALESKDAALRWHAARALGVIGSEKAVDGLRKHAADENAMVRAQAIYALARLQAKDEASLAAIIARLTDPDAQVRRTAVGALRYLQADRTKTFPLIIKVLEDSDPSVIMPALHTLAEGGAEVVPALIEALDHKEARYWTTLILAEIGPDAKAAVPALVKTLVDERPEVRIQTLVALGEIGPAARPAAAAAIKSLDDEYVSVRYAAAFALGRMGDPTASAALAKATASDDAFLKLVATWAAAMIEPQNQEKVAAAIDLLVAGLTDEQAMHREVAARGLIELNQPDKVSKEIDALVPKLSGEQMDQFASAFAALGIKIVPRCVELLPDPARRERALRVLAKLGPQAEPAVPALVALLADESPKVKTEVLFVLGAIGPKAVAAVEPATKLLADKDRDVMLTAAYVLGKIGPEAKAATPELKKLLQSDDELVKLTGVWALLRMDMRDDEYVKYAVPAMAAALKNEKVYIRVEAAMTLGDLGVAAASALPALEAAQADPSPAVRGAATAAIQKIKG
jgi:HEAT repeat protein